MIADIKGSRTLRIVTLILLLLTGGASIYLFTTSALNLPYTVIFWMYFWLILAILFTALSYQNFVVGYLLGLFAMLISWRIVAIYTIDTLTYLFFLAFIFYVANFIYCVFYHLKHQKNKRIPLAEWQIIFIRIYMGFNFIPHFTEKLFAGSAAHFKDVNAFMALNIPDPDAFVWIAGLCEFGAAIALGLGLFMRIGVLGSVVYLMIAADLGHHFSLGFIWANAGGGWEFAAMWAVLMLSFVVTGSHRFSLDQYLEERFSFPPFIRRLM